MYLSRETSSHHRANLCLLSHRSELSIVIYSDSINRHSKDIPDSRRGSHPPTRHKDQKAQHLLSSERDRIIWYLFKALQTGFGRNSILQERSTWLPVTQGSGTAGELASPAGRFSRLLSTQENPPSLFMRRELNVPVFCALVSAVETPDHRRLMPLFSFFFFFFLA